MSMKACIMTGSEARRIREQLGLSVTQLGRLISRAKNSDDAVRHWEAGHKGGKPYPVNPAIALLLRYMERYGLPDEALF